MTFRFPRVPYGASFATCFLLVYVATYSLDCVFVHYGVPVPGQWARARLTILIVAGALYGLLRVCAFHPACDRKYRYWLATVPWTWGKPLPNGPVHLVWADLVILAVPTLLAYLNSFSSPVWPVVAFLLAYLILLAVSLVVSETIVTLVFLFLLPLAVYPFRDPVVAVGVLIALYGLCYGGLKRSLSKFPWNTRFWTAGPEKESLDRAFAGAVIGWPHRFLNVQRTGPLISVPDAFVIGALVTWWAYVLTWAHDKGPGAVWTTVICAGLLLALVRIMVYVFLYWPPISLRGRIFTLRWIIPGYDKVFLAPLAVVLTAFFAPGALAWIGLSRPCSDYLSLFLVVFLAFALPPTLSRWRLTGHHRIPRPGRPQTSNRPSQSSAETAAILGRLQ